MNLSPLAGRILHAILTGIIVFIIVLVIAILFEQLTPLAEVGAVLKKFAAIIGLLAGLASFFTGNRVV